MYDGNPHAPTTAWLDSLAHPHGGYNEAEPGDEGTEIIERDGRRFEVTVRVIPRGEPPKGPIQSWVRANWHRFSVLEEVEVEEVTDRIIEAIKEAGDGDE